MNVSEFFDRNKVSSMNQPEAVVFAGKLIANAIDRHTKLQETSIKMQMKMSGIAGDMLKKMMDSMESMDEGDEWKRCDGNELDDDDRDLLKNV